LCRPVLARPVLYQPVQTAPVQCGLARAGSFIRLWLLSRPEPVRRPERKRYSSQPPSLPASKRRDRPYSWGTRTDLRATTEPPHAHVGGGIAPAVPSLRAASK